MKLLRFFLQLSGVSIIFIGLIYGVAPRAILGDIVGLSIHENQLHIYRSIMGLYCGIGIFLLWGSLSSERFSSALVVEAVFVGGLAAGRILSLGLDGYVHWFSILAVAIELPVLTVCLVLIMKVRKTESTTFRA